jgi:type IV pilus assembly protein PilV
MLVTRSLTRRRQDGFTMVELLITILIVTVGILGLAKMQATAVSNTAVSRTRALMTYQAESLAGTMRSNRSFWVTSGNNATWPKFVADGSGNATTTTGMSSVTSGACTGAAASCTPDKLAYDDVVNTWLPQYFQNFPGATATIVCIPATGSSCGTNPSTPHSYDITLTWAQKMVAMNTSTAGSQTQNVTIVMHVQP